MICGFLQVRVQALADEAVVVLGCCDTLTAGYQYLSFGPIEKIFMFCDLSVREKDWRGKPSL